MFKTPWFDRSLIKTDEGYSVRWGKDWAIYEENGRKLTLTTDVGGGGATIFIGSVSRWDADASVQIDPETRSRIVENVRRALAWKGFEVSILA
jgi:hypothetical protein